MKQIQLSQFDPARLFTYVLSRLVESHGAEAPISSGERAAADKARSSTSSGSSFEEIARTTQRRWSSRYY